MHPSKIKSRYCIGDRAFFASELDQVEGNVIVRVIRLEFIGDVDRVGVAVKNDQTLQTRLTCAGPF